jgi:replicative DNA helicase
MTTSAPSDLAAALRSFPRRLQEAMAPVAGDEEYAASIHVTEVHDEIDRTIREIAAELGMRSSGPLEDVIAATAREIEERPTRNWGTETLDDLQARATHIGGLIREIAKHVDEGR